jgi:hypothetical protein
MNPLTRLGVVTHLVVVLACVFGPGRAMAQTPAPAEGEREAILAVVQAFFDTMAAKDATTARQILLPQSRFYAVGEQAGKAGKAARIRTFTAEEYLFDLPVMKQRVRERIWNPDVRIRGFIANVWTPYDFWADGKLSHCGIDSFDLIKTDQGWRIAGGSYTIEAKCETSPLGKPKQ